MTRSENDSSLSDTVVAGLDVLDDEQGPARPLSVQEAARVADRVLQRHQATSLARGGRARGGFGRTPARRWPRWLLGAAGVTLATAAAALYGTAWFAPNPDRSSAERAAPPARPEAAPERASDPEVGEPAAPLSTTPDAAPDSSGRPTNTSRGRNDGAGGRERRTIAHESPRAADHLARANALRGKRQYREALDLYLHVISEYPDSMQSRAAQLAAAAIRLEQLRDVDGAEELYQAVRKTSDGELAAQAAFGLAEVARARADRGAEARALRDFVARHGGHPLAAAARRRLNALESP